MLFLTHRSVFETSQQRGRQRAGGPQFDTSTLNLVVAQLYFQAVVRQDSGSLAGPFDGDNGCSREVILQSDRFHLLRRVQTVKVDMCQGQAAVVFVQQHKSRTADGLRRRAETRSDSTDKGRFACAQRTEQGQIFPSLEYRADGAAQAIGVPERR